MTYPIYRSGLREDEYRKIAVTFRSSQVLNNTNRLYSWGTVSGANWNADVTRYPAHKGQILWNRREEEAECLSYNFIFIYIFKYNADDFYIHLLPEENFNEKTAIAMFTCIWIFKYSAADFHILLLPEENLNEKTSLAISNTKSFGGIRPAYVYRQKYEHINKRTYAHIHRYIHTQIHLHKYQSKHIRI